MLVPAPPDREPLLWLAPSSLWQRPTTGVDEPAFERPWLVELDTDDFVTAFLAIMSGEDPHGPSAIGDMAPSTGSGTFAAPATLYRPLHGRYYVVVGSLVCRRVGLPDREVQPRGQRISYVMRRISADGAEEAWLAGRRRWVAAARPDALVAGEEQHPMHTSAVDAIAAEGPAAHLLGLDEPGRRQVHYGYVAVAGPSATTPPLADPVAALAADPDAKAGDDPRLMEFRLRIAGAWTQLSHARAKGLDVAEPSLFLLLDLADWLAKYLPDVATALHAGPQLASPPPAHYPSTTVGALATALDVSIVTSTGAMRLGAALAELATFAPLVTGAPHDRPTKTYDVSRSEPETADLMTTLNGGGALLGGAVLDALKDPAAHPKAQVVPPELATAIVPRSTDPVATADRFVLRLVYEHEPCDPVVSKPSSIVRLAANYDPDAPARPIRIELPDPTHLRRFARGVAIDMPPALRNILDRVTPKILKDDPPDGPGQWSIGMVCAFSLQIIMLVAFIVMFIFLILLNIVFWWLPFLKICFPVPRRKSGSP